MRAVKAIATNRRGKNVHHLGENAVSPTTNPGRILENATLSDLRIYLSRPLPILTSRLVVSMMILKRRSPGLQVILSLGGWTFSDPGPTRDAWTKMASTSERRQIFVDSVVKTLETYGLDGIDLDWEYPRADDRGGRPEDYDNYVLVLSAIKRKFMSYNPSWTLSIAIPASYWYLQHFDLKSMESSVDWFNIMSYDIHGRWDKENPYTGPYVLGHTNITEIEMGLDLLRRNNIDLSKVNLGVGFYGRSFTLADASCSKPWCIFSDAGVRGECSREAGILTFAEIVARQNRLNDKRIEYDEKHGVTYMVYEEDQWITYDDDKSWVKKREILDNECFGGVMIWAIDQDTKDFKALSGLLGDSFVSDALIDGGILSDDEKIGLAEELGGLTGDSCYVTMGCSGPDSEDSKFNTCEKGDVAIERLHAPGGAPENFYRTPALAHEASGCKTGQWKTVCCSAKSPAINCKWQGAPERSSLYCNGGLGQKTCGTGRYELVTDRYTTYQGGAICASGARSLCCDSAELLQQCAFSECQDEVKCPKGGWITYRGNEEGGKPCPEGQMQSYCCPIGGIYDDCQWKPTVPIPTKSGTKTQYFQISSQQCMDSKCPKGQITITKATLPERPGSIPAPCAFYTPGLEHRFCCNPLRDVDTPFDPKMIFKNPSRSGSDILYSYKDNYGNNDKDPHGPDETDIGEDPYGFVVFDGDEVALQARFAHDFTFVHEHDGTGKPISKRETLQRDNLDIMDWTFEHEEGTHLIYCRKDHEESCENVFKGDAFDTIISLPPHIGSGPYARIIAMEHVEERKLPKYHLKKRSFTEHTSKVYSLKFDYDFAAIKRQDATVNVRIDYTNLVPYWDEMTGKKSGKGSGNSKRTNPHTRHDKRWWGSFIDWCKKMTKVETSDAGKLPFSIRKRLLLYHKRVSCARGNVNLKAGLDVILDAKFDMNARWAYYASGTIVPLAVDSIYTYFEMEPTAEAILEIAGNAEMEWISDRLKIIDTLSYPGLAIKGVAAIGPTLDLWGQMKARATIAGQLRAGAKVTFPKYEVYFPQVPEANEYTKLPIPAQDKEEGSKGTNFVPILDASVKATVGVDLLITPEVNLGIKVTSPKIKGDIVNAQIVGFVNNTFRFEVTGEGTGGIGNNPAVSYHIFIKYIYNFGIGGVANFKWLGTYALKPFYLWDKEQGREKILYEHHGKVAIGKRNPFVSDGADTYVEKFEPIFNSTYQLSDNWYAAGGALSRSSLHKRAPVEDHPTIGNKAKIFTCNDGGKCKSGECSSGSCEWVPPKKPAGNKQRRVDEDPDPDPMDTDKDTPCQNSIPAFMYNCKYFPDRTGENEETFKGICHNILDYFNDFGGGGEGPITLTYNDLGKSGTSNRGNVCGAQMGKEYTSIGGSKVPKETEWSDACGKISDIYSDAIKVQHGRRGNSNWLSCDEFPFNAVQEGGDATKNSRACVPGYQQNYQGGSNSLLLRNIEQEVYWQDSNDKPKKDRKKWDTDWATNSALYGSTRRGESNRDKAWNWDKINKKKFTMHVFDSDDGSAPGGHTYAPLNHAITTGDLVTQTDISKVVAAINFLDNPKYTPLKYNAYCVKEDGFVDHLWGKYPRMGGCVVKFDNAKAVAKIARGETPTQEEMFNVKTLGIEYVDDEQDNIQDLNEPRKHQRHFKKHVADMNHHHQH
ncbi:hypothetical protein B0J11DRAFT_551302 [Dendryphion nanum]|uniref:chitinase n=1 Tax=Dendryphion nanum TaxID=256645 RepID=A0A9P9IKJ8_9PLEO|nr:hypothetical protein B0J11DRAFT_551302 [Dendryphion nanum]